jgi:HTH-type transcriptional regulator / antitoxin HigA
MSDSAMMERPDWVPPPGHTIVSILEERELSIEQFAQQIGRSTSIAQMILDGAQAIDRGLARQLASAVGATENFWMAREYDYRASIVEPELVRVTSLDELLRKLPVRDMESFGWIPTSRSKDDKLDECLSFFGVSSLAQWQGRYEDAFQQAAYRRSAAHNSCEVATTAWLRQGEIATQGDQVGSWSPDALMGQIPHLKRLTWFKSPDLFLPKVKKFLANAGVKYAIVRAPKGCTASGAVRILSDGTPHMQLSFRFLSDDQFWFSLFHEIGHLLLHFEKMPILERSGQTKSESEEEADEFASSTIVPLPFREELLTLGGSRLTIIDFAKKVGVAPGLIVGQLQHAGFIRYNQMQRLKRRYEWA